MDLDARQERLELLLHALGGRLVQQGDVEVLAEQERRDGQRVAVLAEIAGLEHRQ